LNVQNDRYFIRKGLDETKDQSYVLWGLSQKSLSRTLFPVGAYRKTRIREMAIEMGYEFLAKKSESYEICFVPDNDYRGFLKRRVDGLEERVDGGNFVLEDGTVIGRHRGYPFHTIGQRKGLEIAVGRPLFVTRIEPDSNTVVLGDEEQLNHSGLVARFVNLQKYENVGTPMDAVTKVRYKDAGHTSRICQIEGNKVDVQFDHQVKAIAPGQASVFYDNEDVIGGGWIEKAYDIN
jgi:tRNA-specific 2-thiouridylase